MAGQTPREIEGRFFTVVENKKNAGPAEVFLYDFIGGFFGTSPKEFREALSDLKGRDVDLHVNSPGGDVYDATAIYNAIGSHSGKVVAYVDGLAASAASFLIMAADEVVMEPHSRMMIHEAHGIGFGNAADMAKLSERLDKTSDEIASIYTEKAGGEVSEWRDRMEDETWYSDQEAVDAGLADEVGDRSTESDDDDAAENLIARYDVAALFRKAPVEKTDRGDKIAELVNRTRDDDSLEETDHDDDDDDDKLLVDPREAARQRLDERLARVKL
jgi:ATP-dependent protease ClpP protease subunit